MFEFKFLLSNKGSSRGVALLTERRTKVELDYCSFNNNQSTDLGGSIFNRGSMKVSNSVFSMNLGSVSYFHVMSLETMLIVSGEEGKFNISFHFYLGWSNFQRT